MLKLSFQIGIYNLGSHYCSGFPTVANKKRGKTKGYKLKNLELEGMK